MKSEWFRVRLQASDPRVAEILVFDSIGDWTDDAIKGQTGADGPVTAASFVKELAKLPETVKTLKVRLNSPGGDVFGGIAIANALRSERARGRRVETIVEGLAASAASIIAMGGSPVKIADDGIMMVHAPWSVTFGNARDFRATADMLDKIQDTLVKTYQWHSKLDAEKITALIHGEDGNGTWMDADEAIANGFVNEKVEGLKVEASIDPRPVAALKVPAKFAARVKSLVRPEATPTSETRPEGRRPAPPSPAPIQATKPVSPDQVLRACAEAGLDLEFARATIAENPTVEALSSRISIEKETRVSAESRARHIRLLCGKAHADLAPDLIASAMTFDQVKGYMCRVAAKLDKVEIDCGLAPANGAKRRSVIDIAEIYGQRNNH